MIRKFIGKLMEGQDDERDAWCKIEFTEDCKDLQDALDKDELDYKYQAIVDWYHLFLKDRGDKWHVLHLLKRWFTGLTAPMLTNGELPLSVVLRNFFPPSPPA